MRAAAAILALALGACEGPAAADGPALAQTPAPAGWRMSSVTLYLPDSVFEERISSADLADYIKRLRAEAAAAFASRSIGPGASGAVVFIIQPDGQSRLWLVSGEPAVDAAISEVVIRRLETVPAPRPKGGPVAAALIFDLWGGGAPPPGMPMPLPESWRRLIPEGGMRMDDDFLDKAWKEG
jgi:hypothetical protein